MVVGRAGINRTTTTTVFAFLVVTVALATNHLTTANQHTFHNSRQNELVRSLASYEIAIPTRIHDDGNHLSHHVTYHRKPEVRRRRRRSVAFWENEKDHVGGADDDRLHYKLTVEGEELHLELIPNDWLFAPGLVVERRSGRHGNRTTEYGRKGAEVREGRMGSVERINHNRCHFTGKLRDRPESKVAIATCDGLHGYIHTGKRDYFVEPIQEHNKSSSVGHPHLIYRRSALPTHLLPAEIHSTVTDVHKSCGVTDDDSSAPNRPFDRSSSGRRRRRRQKRSVSLERNVETLVVVDQKMMEYYKNENIENYVLTIMNMVSAMFHDASIGNAVNIVLVRIIYLEQEEKNLTIQTHADHTLTSFCRWQMGINPKDDKHPNHHDVAILLTRLDICSRSSEPCSTLGLSQVSGMCQPNRSCNINQDTGLALAFTVAHELGHNFWMQHDTPENGCEAQTSGLQYIMSPQVTAEASPLVWSNCSRMAITAFLDRDWGYCLEDEPSDHGFEFPVLPPGVMYDIDHQCRLQYGPEAEFCDGIDDLCSTVWCRVDNRCLTRLEAPAEGTLCGDNEWCFGGRCIEIGEKPLAIDSHWGEWGSWSECTRSCGAGVSLSERLCNNPPPSHGGQYCLGERKRFRICNSEPCPEGSPSFREHQCTEFNNVPFRGSLHQWEPTSNPSSPCQLYCKSKTSYISVMRKDMVIDGTPCRTGRRDMCISGRCRTVGCDWIIESDAKEDRCGVCHGDGSTCTTVKESFDKKDGRGYVEATVIPEGARNIRVEEVAEANNYLALRNDKGDYYLNGHFFIQWSGDYEVAGTVIQYRRNGNKDSFYTPGPIKEPLHVMLLFQSENPGIKLEYTVPNENATEKRREEFYWKYSDWTHCTASCGGGSQLSEVVCVGKEVGIVEDFYCNMSDKPDDMHKTCNTHLCPARWWSGPWQHCSVTCGENGFHKRTVLCVRQLGPDEQIALEDWECDGLEKPPDIDKCRHKEPCPVEDIPWKTGPWSEVCRDDPCAVQKRDVECLDFQGYCDSSLKPPTERPCSFALCGHWKTGDWSQCTQSCGGGGTQFRSVTCHSGRSCPSNLKPIAERPCNQHECFNAFEKSTTSLIVNTMNGNTENVVMSNNVNNNINNNINNNSLGNGMNKNFGSKDGLLNNDSSYEVPKDSTENASDVSTQNVTTTTMMSSPPTTVRLPEYGWVNMAWSNCSRLCGSGYRERKVVCMNFDLSSTVPSEFCANKTKQAEREACQQEPCITWTATAWGPCSASCGDGIQRRMVSCAQPDLCDPDTKPFDNMNCSLGPCFHWSVSSWSECSQTCGSGLQQRDVTCVDNATQQAISGCDDTTRPALVQNCNVDNCPNNLAALGDKTQTCTENFLNDVMCASLRDMGRCSMAYVQRKCCKACLRSTALSKPRGES